MMNTTTPIDIDMLIDSVSKCKSGTALDRNILHCALHDLKTASAGGDVKLSIRKADQLSEGGYRGVVLECENTYMAEDVEHVHPCYVFSLLESSNAEGVKPTLLKLVNVIASQKLFDDLFGCSHTERIFRVISTSKSYTLSYVGTTDTEDPGTGDTGDAGTAMNPSGTQTASTQPATNTKATAPTNNKQATVTPVAATSATTDKK